MSNQRSVWISAEVWSDMHHVAKLLDVSVSQYLRGLHRAHRGNLPETIDEVFEKAEEEWIDTVTKEVEGEVQGFVESEELDANPDKYPVGTVGITTDPEKAIKKPLIVNIEEPKGDVDGTSPVEIVPMPTPDARQESESDTGGTVDWRKGIKARPKGEDGKKTK